MSTMSIVAPGRGTRGKTPRGKAARESGISRTGAMLIMAVFTVYFLLPLWWLLVASSKETGDILTTAPLWFCLLYTSPSPRDLSTSRMPSSA